jgi:hypothetical protein
MKNLGASPEVLRWIGNLLYGWGIDPRLPIKYALYNESLGKVAYWLPAGVCGGNVYAPG